MRSSGATLHQSRLEWTGQDLALMGAIGKAGTMGITAKQLGTVTGLPLETVSQLLDDLSSRHSIGRMGRGLWVLKKHENFRSPDHARYEEEFEHRFGLKVGAFDGKIKFRSNEKLPVHRWWPYVQGFSAEFVEKVEVKYGIGRGSTVLDPFCGSGTVPIVSRSMGAKGLGIDMMPIAAFVADAKGEWSIDADDLWKSARRIAAVERDPLIPRPFLKETPRHYSEDVTVSLLRLKENIWKLEGGGIKTLLKLAFASILIESSHLKRSPCLGYAKGKVVAPETPARLFLDAVANMRDDLRTLGAQRDGWGPRPVIVCGDAGKVDLDEASVDLAITSPPYVNGMDYVMNYKLDLVWMDLIGSYAELAQLRASMVACDNIPKGTASRHDPSVAVRSDDWLVSLRAEIDANIRAKATYRRTDMGAIVTKYFDDLVPVMRNVLKSLKPGGRFVVVNGDSLMAGAYVPGDMIFARLAAGTGFEVEAFDVARVRRSGQRRGYLLRESVTTLRKPLS